MNQLRMTMKVPETGEIVVALPPGFSRGEVEVIILAADPNEQHAGEAFDRWIEAWISSLPPAPSLPLSALDRGEIYR